MAKPDLRQWGHTLWRLFAIAVLSFGVVWLYAYIALNLSLFNPVSKAIADYNLNDFFYQVLESTGTPDTSRTITIVDMTDLYSRRELAASLMAIDAEQPRVVGIDMVFEGLKEDYVGDSMIAAVALHSPEMVFSYKLIDDSWDGKEYHQTRSSFFADSLSIENQGITNMPRNLYGSMKRALPVARPLNGEMRPSFIKRVAEIYAGEELVKAADRDIKINFSPMVFQVVPADSIAEYANLITDRVVLFGAMREEADMHDTPVGKIAGIKLLAYSVDTLLRHKEIQEVPLWLLCIISVLVVMATHAIFDRYGKFVKARKFAPLRIFLGLTAVKGLIKFFWMALIMGGAFLLFCYYDLSINLTYATAAVAFTTTGEDIYNALKEQFTKKKA